MKYRKLGNTNIDVSVICLGTMTFGEQNSKKESFDQMDLAFDKGINFFDTAEIYPIYPKKKTSGRTEEYKGRRMKKDIHPEYRDVIFKDVSTDFAILTKSTIKTSETIKWEDGKEYPLYKLDISSKSHPYFTGEQNLVDTAGRIEKFNQKYNLKTSTDSNKN